MCAESHNLSMKRKGAVLGTPFLPRPFCCLPYPSPLKAGLLTRLHVVTVSGQSAHVVVCKSCGQHCNLALKAEAATYCLNSGRTRCGFPTRTSGLRLGRIKLQELPRSWAAKVVVNGQLDSWHQRRGSGGNTCKIGTPGTEGPLQTALQLISFRGWDPSQSLSGHRPTWV